MSDDIPIDIPGFDIKRLIGKGGFAKVYLAEQKSLERDVALKVMDPKMVSDQDFCDRFLKEGKTLAKLSSHPDILTIYDIGHRDSIYYMSMEYVGAPNLKDRIKGQIGLERPLQIMRQVAGALGYVHKHDFIHRDVKPANVLFHENGSAVLADFGIAKTLKGGTQLTQVGFTVGTPEYMSPEQTLGKELDGRADLYSLGVMFYEMLTFTKPFIGKDPFAIALKHLNDPIPQLPDEHSKYQECLNLLLAKDPEQRFSNAEKLLEYLEHLELEDRFESTGYTKTRSKAVPSDSRAAEVPQRKATVPNRKLAGALVGAGGILAALGVGFVYFQSNRQVSDVGPAPADVSLNTDVNKAAASTLTPELRLKVQRLIETAEAHEIIGRLVEPPGANALEAYEIVLELEPGNAAARAAVARIKSGTGE